tara:strand:- start:84 stop:1370 length:1287 start_codon:yes stop_codon:yes gene_type:complete
MKKIIIIFSLLIFSNLSAEEDLKFYVNKAIENNLKLNAERKNYQSSRQKKNISRSEFLPNITISGDQTSTTSTNRTDQSGSSLGDSNSDTENRTISVEQKIFSGFKGYNTFKKTELETHKANLELIKVEQQTILDTASAFSDLIFKYKNEEFNILNVNLFERQVESDSARMQKGEITLTDLAQSESSLAGARAELIKAKTELFSSKKNFERITREKAPKVDNLISKIRLNLPNSLNSSLEISKLNNVDLLIAQTEFEITTKQLEIEKARLSPSASITVSKSQNRDFSSTVDEKDDETVKATITWPIIKGGENISTIKKSSLDKQRAKFILQDTKDKTVTETSVFWSKFQSSKSVLDATRSQLKAAEIANEGISLEYDSGNTRTTLEVIQSRSLLLESRIASAKAERDFIISQFELAKQIGTLSPKLLN